MTRRLPQQFMLFWYESRSRGKLKPFKVALVGFSMKQTLTAIAITYIHHWIPLLERLRDDGRETDAAHDGLVGNLIDAVQIGMKNPHFLTPNTTFGPVRLILACQIPSRDERIFGLAPFGLGELEPPGRELRRAHSVLDERWFLEGTTRRQEGESPSQGTDDST